MTEKIWKNERPEWCKHKDCIFKKSHQNLLCGGNLPVPLPHNRGFNDYRFCIRFQEDGAVTDIQCNASDLDYFRSIFDALDGKKTSWLTKE